jgi:hypothetical protein
MSGSREMAQYLTSADISCLNLKDYLDANDRSLHLPEDFHWNVAGHKRVAETLTKYIGKFLK